MNKALFVILSILLLGCLAQPINEATRVETPAQVNEAVQAAEPEVNASVANVSPYGDLEEAELDEVIAAIQEFE